VSNCPLCSPVPAPIGVFWHQSGTKSDDNAGLETKTEVVKFSGEARLTGPSRNRRHKTSQGDLTQPNKTGPRDLTTPNSTLRHDATSPEKKRGCLISGLAFFYHP